MLHTYRKTALIEAEQFDGSIKQIARYKVHIVGSTSCLDGFKSIDGEVRQTEHHRNRNDEPAILLKEPPVGTFYVDPTIDGYIKLLYSRLLIRHK